MGTKPPAAVDGRISKDGRHDSDAAAPHTPTTSSLQGKAGGSAFTPKLVELVFGPGSTRCAEKQSPPIACTAVARPPCARESSCLLARLPPWRDVAAELNAPGLLHDGPSSSSHPKCRPACCPIDRKNCPSFSAVYRTFLHKVDIYPPAWVRQTRILLAGGWSNCPQGQPRNPSVA